MTTTPVATTSRKPLLAKNPFRGPHPGVTIPYLVVGEAAFLLALVLAAEVVVSSEVLRGD